MREFRSFFCYVFCVTFIHPYRSRPGQSRKSVVPGQKPKATGGGATKANAGKSSNATDSKRTTVNGRSRPTRDGIGKKGAGSSAGSTGSGDIAKDDDAAKEEEPAEEEKKFEAANHMEGDLVDMLGTVFLCDFIGSRNNLIFLYRT